MRVQSWLERSAERRPEHVAVESAEGAISYAELLWGATLGAERLAALGVRPQQRVALALPAGIDFAIALHAILLAEAIAVPIDLRLSDAEREHRSAGCVVSIDQPLAHAPQQAPALSARTHDLDAVALEIFTSGTSARPKPVALTYRNLLFAALGSAVAIGCEPHDRWLCVMPLAHIGGLSILLRSALCSTTAVVHERFATEPVLAALREERITVVSLVATMLGRLLEGGLRQPPSLRCALIGGGPVGEDLLSTARAAGVPVRATYGMSESCAQAATEPVSDPGGGARPLFCTRVRIAADGEILLAGPTIAPGALSADGWLHTGDLGALDADGRLQVRGRISETIISGGENISPEEVEAVLARHPEVLEAAVIGRPDQQWGEAVCAVVVPVAGFMPAERELRAHCSQQLAPFKVPKAFAISDQPLPRTASGKLLRRQVQAPEREHAPCEGSR